MRYPVVNVGRPSLGIAPNISELLAKYNLQNEALKNALSNISPQPPISVRTEPPLPEPPMSVASGGVPSEPPPEIPGISPEPAPPPPGPPRPDVASIDVRTTREREVFGPPKPPPPPPPEPPLQPPISVQSGYVPPTSVATGVPTSQPPLPPPPVPTEVPGCYSCDGSMEFLSPEQAGQRGCVEVSDDKCRPSVPSVDRYIPAINPFSMIPGGLDAGAAGAVAAPSLLGRISYPVTNLFRGL